MSNSDKQKVNVKQVPKRQVKENKMKRKEKEREGMQKKRKAKEIKRRGLQCHFNYKTSTE